MSYGLNLYCIEKPNLKLLEVKFMATVTKDQNQQHAVIKSEDYLIKVLDPILLEDEDIPLKVASLLPGISFLVECHVESNSNKPVAVKTLNQIASFITKTAIGVIENPQTDEIILPQGIKRCSIVKDKKTEKRFSVIQLSWWFNSESFFLKNFDQIIQIIEKQIPEALPRRYGIYEPPSEKYTGSKDFKDYFINKTGPLLVWYPSKPIDSVYLNIPNPIGPIRIGYRFGHFTISIDESVLDLPGWKTSIRRLFIQISEVLTPFYADVYLLRNKIRSRRTSHVDTLTESHPIKGWWWNGIPRSLGLGIVVGKTLQPYVQIDNPIIMNNGSQFLLNDDLQTNIPPKKVKIQTGILQSKRRSDNILYPKIWPFNGPKK